MVWITAVADSRWELYEDGSRISPLAQVTLDAHGGGSGEDVTEAQCGLPERETETTDQPRWAAARQMRLPSWVSELYWKYFYAVDSLLFLLYEKLQCRMYVHGFSMCRRSSN